MIKREYVYRGISYRYLSIKEQRKCSMLPIQSVYKYIYDNCFTSDYKSKSIHLVQNIVTCIFNESRSYIAPITWSTEHEAKYKFYKTLITEKRRQTLEDSIISVVVKTFPGTNPLELEDLSMEELASLFSLAQSIVKEDLLELSTLKQGFNLHTLEKLSWCPLFAKMKRKVLLGMDPHDTYGDESD